ncbi:hypothetical protein D3C72_1921780 [compost metagenome]
MNGLQAVLAAVELLAHVLGEHQVAVQVVGPAVIRADDVADRALVRVAEPRAAMAADVVEGADLHVVVAYDQDRVVAELDRYVITRLWHVRLDRHLDPVLAENRLHVQREDILAQIEGRLEAVSRLAPLHQRANVCRYFHCLLRISCIPGCLPTDRQRVSSR